MYEDHTKLDDKFILHETCRKNIRLLILFYMNET